MEKLNKMRTKEEHLKWCEERALRYLDRGQTGQASLSFASDLTKHPKTEILQELCAFATYSDSYELEKFIKLVIMIANETECDISLNRLVENLVDK